MDPGPAGQRLLKHSTAGAGVCAIYSVPHTEIGRCATRLAAHEDREDARRVFVDQAAGETLSATLTPSTAAGRADGDQCTG
jgi:hypothetical protein